MQHLAGFDPGAAQAASNTVGPHLEIVRGVADDGRFTRGPRAGMHTSELIARDCEKAKGIILTQVGLPKERELDQIVERRRVGDVSDALGHDGHVGSQTCDR